MVKIGVPQQFDMVLPIQSETENIAVQSGGNFWSGLGDIFSSPVIVGAVQTGVKTWIDNKTGKTMVTNTDGSTAEVQKDNSMLLFVVVIAAFFMMK
jgi:hypothetical protein